MRLTEFLEPFFPDDAEQICLFWIYPDKKSFIGSWKPVSRYQLANDKNLQKFCRDKNKEHGLYFTVNFGGSKIVDITRTNAVFCERDEGTFAEQHEYIDNCPIQPSIRTETLKSVHAYWLLDESIPVADWKAIQCGLIDYFHADPQLKNANRIMRLPFFNHVRKEDDVFAYKPVTIHTFEPTRHNASDLKKAFPYSRPQPKYREMTHADTLSQTKQALAFRIQMHSTYKLESNKRWGTCQGICHNGNGVTALAVNWEDLYIYCQKGCSLDQIASAFGVAMPVYESWSQRIENRVGQSKTYEWLRDYKSRGLAR